MANKQVSCSKCGGKNPHTAITCAHCGTRVGAGGAGRREGSIAQKVKGHLGCAALLVILGIVAWLIWP